MSEVQENQSTENTASDAVTSTAEIHAAIKAKFNNLVDVKDTKFHFKKTLNELKEEVKRPTVELALPVPSVEGLIDIISNKGGKELDLVMDALYEVIVQRARELVNEDEGVNQDNFPFDKLSWEAIANLPKAERRGGGISKEVWEAFGADYLEVMPAVTGKKQEAIENAVKIYLNKFSTVKTAKPILAKLKEQLALYIGSTAKAEEFTECVDFLVNKADNLLNVDEASLLANL